MKAVTRKIAGTSPAAASTAALGQVADLDDVDSVQIYADLVGATGGTLDVYLQTSPDGGTTWFDWLHFPQLGAGASAVRYGVAPAQSNTITVIGKGTTPALAANTCVGGRAGNIVRALCVAGASTSAGAALTIWFVCTSPRP